MSTVDLSDLSRACYGGQRRQGRIERLCSVPYLHDVESGKRAPLRAELDEKLAELLGLTPARLRVLRALARGVVEVGGLGEAEVAVMVGLVEELRAGEGVSLSVVK